MKTQYDSLIRANVKVSNDNDEARAYSISADVQVAKGMVENINNGVVLKDDAQVATFNRWSASNMNVTFNNISNSEQCTVLGEINAFVDSVKALVKAQGISL